MHLPTTTLLSTLLLSILHLPSAALAQSSTTTTTTSTLVPDTPVQYYAEIFANTSTCDTATTPVYAFLPSGGVGCLDRALAAADHGSVRLRVGSVLHGWTGAGCTGEQVLAVTTADGCAAVGVDVGSWSSY